MLEREGMSLAVYGARSRGRDEDGGGLYTMRLRSVRERPRVAEVSSLAARRVHAAL